MHEACNQLMVPSNAEHRTSPLASEFIDSESGMGSGVVLIANESATGWYVGVLSQN